MLFYLGTHMPHWCGLLDVPLFISRHRIWKRRTLPRAAGRYALDSGGFTVLSQHGQWDTDEAKWAAFLTRCDEEMGHYDFAAPLDYMCEPYVLKRTGLTVAQHQERTIDSFACLRYMGMERVIPVLQGWELADYLRCVERYAARGIDLTTESTVGLGSVCRREGMAEAEQIVRRLHAEGLRLHGFGFKKTGLRNCADALVSADSMAWSFVARREAERNSDIGHCGAPLRSDAHPAKNCANCKPWALLWRQQLLEGLA